MILGHVRDNFPYVTLALPGREGPLHVEFVIDTGFDGELALPASLLNDLDTAFIGDHAVLLADRTRRSIPHYEIEIDWHDEKRSTEVIALEGRPLLGNGLMEGSSVHIEMADGGEVV